jgi:hypothetical protein
MPLGFKILRISPSDASKSGGTVRTRVWKAHLLYVLLKIHALLKEVRAVVSREAVFQILRKAVFRRDVEHGLVRGIPVLEKLDQHEMHHAVTFRGGALGALRTDSDELW